jgi:hypothetical protein
MRKIFALLCLFFVSFSLFSCNLEITPLDKILNYTITVSPNDDGTLDMTYYLKWKVLEDGDGGLSWIVVGVPNRFVSEIKPLTNNIDDIYYTSDDGAQIRLDLDKTYHKGDVLELEFSFKQSRIFSLVDDEVEYSFNPGWFEEIQVDNICVYWNADDILYANTETVNGWLVWEGSLDYGQTIECNVKYSRNTFPNLNPKEDYSEQIISDFAIYLIIITVVVVFTLIIVVAIVCHDPYSQSRGFSGHIHTYHYHIGRRRGYRRDGSIIVNPTNGGTSGVGRACACACACAGGGRAGCSRKEFTKALKI